MKKNNITKSNSKGNVKEVFIRTGNLRGAAGETFFIPQVFDKIKHLLIKRQLRFYKNSSKRAVDR